LNFPEDGPLTDQDLKGAVESFISSLRER
jgi:hypothetical protein